MRIDPYGKSHGSLRGELEVLTRAELTTLCQEAVAELSRRALKMDDETEANKKAADYGRPRW